MKMLIPQIFLLILMIALIFAVIVFIAFSSSTSDYNALQVVIPLLVIVIATISLLVFSWLAYHHAQPQRAQRLTYIPFLLTVPYLLYIIFQILMLFGAAL